MGYSKEKEQKKPKKQQLRKFASLLCDDLDNPLI